MAAILESLQRSSINIKSISQTLFDTKKSTSAVNESVGNISRIVATNTRVKRQLFERSNILSSRREEASKRQELEDQIESTRVSSSPKAGLSFSSRSEKGPLERLLGFLGFTFAGWIVENLPTWIFMGQEFISRINSFGRSMYTMVYNMQNIIKYFGDTLGYSLNSILRLDFDEFAGEGTVARSFEELNLAVQDLGTNITDTFKLFTTPLTESLETGEQAPALDEERPDTMFPGVQQETAGSPIPSYSGQETTAGGKVLNPQAAYAYIRQLGVSHIHALGILANIKGESEFRIDADETGKGTGGIGLFQYTFPSRKKRFLQAVPDYKTNWKAQLDYAIKNDENTPLYLKKQFGTPEEAADDFMRNWENPSKSVYAERRRKHNEFIKSFKPSSGQPQKPTVTPQTQTPQISPPPSTPVNPMIGDRLGAGRGHGGVDLQVKEGTSLRAISDGIIVDSDYEKGWGNFLVMKDNLGIYHLYGHMQSGYKRSGSVKKGEVIGKVGMTGRTTGPHLHWETGTGWNGGVITGRFDALNKYSRFAPFNTQPGKDTKTETPAQISAQPKQSQPAAMTPERKGSQVMLIDATQPQVPQASYPSQQQPSITSIVSEFKMLNNFIKNKLLIDLAYL
jgi:murein DD-endopeptidase MepM/ murein hydrolase activator NlpD